jgi:membrane fusion protein, copper/silver efflux system
MTNRRQKLLRDWRELSFARRAATIGLAVVIFLAFFMVIGVESTHEHSEDGTAAHGSVWTCSMHPQVRQPEPGSCPICGMALIPVVDDDDPTDDRGPVRLVVSERAAALMDVRVWPAERRDVTRDVRLFGRVSYDETRISDVVLRVEGQIERLHVAFENAPVRAGAPVAEVYSPSVQAAGREYVEAFRIGDERLVAAARGQLETLGMSAAHIDRIRDSGEVPRTFTVTAPAGGVVQEIVARTGDWVQAGGRIMRISGLDRVWVELEAYEADIAALRQGQRVFFELESYPGETFEGRVAFVDPTLGADRRTAGVRVDVANPGGRLMPGMFVRARIAGTATDAAPLVIPTTAPLITGRRAVVYVRVPGMDRPTFEPREVTLGERTGEHFAVVDGLSEGELVVVNGAFRIDSELQIRGRPSMMNPAEEPQRLPQLQHDHRVDVDLQIHGTEPLVAGYLAFAEALAADRPASARQAAHDMRRAIDGLQGEGMDWTDVRARLSAAAEAARTSDNLDEIRDHLTNITQLVEQIAAADDSVSGTLHIAFCPMANNDAGGRWLTDAPEIRNPYFGASMLQCGEIEGTV